MSTIERLTHQRLKLRCRPAKTQNIAQQLQEAGCAAPLAQRELAVKFQVTEAAIHSCPSLQMGDAPIAAARPWWDWPPICRAVFCNVQLEVKQAEGARPI